MRRGSGVLDVAERLRLEAAIDDAFAPLRLRTASVGPARARAAARWRRPDEPDGLRGFAFFSRLSELSVAVAVTAFLFSGSLLSAVAPRQPDGSAATAAALGRTLNGRLADQHPITSTVADARAWRADEALNAAALRRQASDAPLAVETHDGLSIKP